jgi:hypothetical protein
MWRLPGESSGAIGLAWRFLVLFGAMPKRTKRSEVERHKQQVTFD